LASIVKESEVSRILTYKDDENSLNMHERERPMLHDSYAFKNRLLSVTKTPNAILKTTDNKNAIAGNSKKVGFKALFKTTVTKPFHHKNFSEIPD